MKKLTDLEYLKLNKIQKFGYNFVSFFAAIPSKLVSLGKKIGVFFARVGRGIANLFKDIGTTFVKGDWRTKTSYFIMGFGSAARGQWLRGVMFFALEVAFIIYMIFVGAPNVALLGSLGTVKTTTTIIHIAGREVVKTIYGDDSFSILLYGVLSLFFIIALAYTWYINIKQNKISEQILDVPARKALAKERDEAIKQYYAENGKTKLSKAEAQAVKVEIANRYEEMIAKIPNDREHRKERKYLMQLRDFEMSCASEPKKVRELSTEYKQKIDGCGKPLVSGKQDVQSLIDDQFHKTLLSIPLLGIVVFTVLPTFFMILIAFTNYSGPNNLPPNDLFTWLGLDNEKSAWKQLLSFGDGNAYFTLAFGEILLWTLIWAFFATFTNYFLGMLVALAINKKGIKGKKIFRGILVLTIAIPQFISLLYISQMFSKDGIINNTLLSWGWIDEALPFFTDRTWARITVIIINIWIGIPYLMLMISGVLMNIPADLYESAKIDGASPMQQYFKITLPYTLFVTGPYLLTSFTGNMNNFNVIFLLTGGGPTNNYDMQIAKAGETDLLVTWLFKLTVSGTEPLYNLAAVIGILIFVVVAVISLVVYNIIPSVKNEEDFQ